jgi:hypothetical protein
MSKTWLFPCLDVFKSSQESLIFCKIIIRLMDRNYALKLNESDCTWVQNRIKSIHKSASTINDARDYNPLVHWLTVLFFPSVVRGRQCLSVPFRNARNYCNSNAQRRDVVSLSFWKLYILYGIYVFLCSVTESNLV